jgi:hypothetical protein
MSLKVATISKSQLLYLDNLSLNILKFSQIIILNVALFWNTD